MGCPSHCHQATPLQPGSRACEQPVCHKSVLKEGTQSGNIKRSSVGEGAKASMGLVHSLYGAASSNRGGRCHYTRRLLPGPAHSYLDVPEADPAVDG
jgi:hypothetical protein